MLFRLDGMKRSREFKRLKVKRYGRSLSPGVYMEIKARGHKLQHRCSAPPQIEAPAGYSNKNSNNLFLPIVPNALSFFPLSPVSLGHKGTSAQLEEGDTDKPNLHSIFIMNFPVHFLLLIPYNHNNLHILHSL